MKDTKSDTSEVFPILPKGIDFSSFSFTSSFKLSVISDIINPGATEFTVIFLEATSLANDLVKPSIAALEAE